MSGSTDDQLDTRPSVPPAAHEHHLGSVQLILEAFPNSIAAVKGVSSPETDLTNSVSSLGPDEELLQSACRLSHILNFH